MRGRTSVLALVAIAAMLLVSAVALAHEGRPAGTKDADDLTMSDGNDRVFARGGDDSVDGSAGNDRLRGGRGNDELFGGDGDDRLKGGQDNDYLDGGEGDDYINGRGDGRDGDEIVCGNGYDVAVLGRGDVIVTPGAAAEDGVESDEGESDEVEPDEVEPDEVEPDEDTSDDGCEKVKRPKGKHRKGKHHGPCAANSQGCDDDGAIEDPCAARYMPRCGDPEVVMPEPDEPVEEPAPDELGEY
jgi:hemolysin type calcium-binding protein